MKTIKMKTLFLTCYLLVCFASPGLARDFIVEFIEENYKETQEQFSYDPLIYHSIQVASDIGPKLLILTGKDYTYRKWLRHYIAFNKKFIARVPDDQIDQFISSKAYEIDVTALHPVNMEQWKKSNKKVSDQNTIKGIKHILIVDPNEKRTNLIQTIAQKMGYPTTNFRTGTEALESFMLQPEKFSMVIVHHTIQGMQLDEFISKTLKLSHTIPVVIDPGYNNQEKKNRLISKFSGSSSIHIKPVILKELQKTIEKLINKNV